MTGDPFDWGPFCLGTLLSWDPFVWGPIWLGTHWTRGILDLGRFFSWGDFGLGGFWTGGILAGGFGVWGDFGWGILGINQNFVSQNILQ